MKPRVRVKIIKEARSELDKLMRQVIKTSRDPKVKAGINFINKLVKKGQIDVDSALGVFDVDTGGIELDLGKVDRLASRFGQPKQVPGMTAKELNPNIYGASLSVPLEEDGVNKLTEQFLPPESVGDELIQIILKRGKEAKISYENAKKIFEDILSIISPQGKPIGITRAELEKAVDRAITNLPQVP